MDAIMNYLFNLGLNDRVTKTQLIDKAQAVMLIADICGDCTMTETVGVYTHEDGQRVIENGFKIEVYDITQEQADTMSYELAKTFNQECVVQTQFNTNSKFVLLQR